MGFHNLVLLLCFASWCLCSASQLQSSQVQVLLQLKKHLEYPKQLDIWKNRWSSFCSSSPSSQVNVTCQGSFVTELSIVGDANPSKVSDFNGSPIPNQTLSENFSMDSFVATLARLTSLKVLRLVSLGMWGPLPNKIQRLNELDHLDLSSNFLYGSIPPKISNIANLRVLALDDNFFNSTIPVWFNSLTNLTVLGLSNNRLKGQLGDFSALSALEVLDLRENRLASTLPNMPKGLMRLFLSKNSFSGEIPEQYGQLNGLKQLDISFNTLTGSPPSEIFSLPSIVFLNLASNMLSGSLHSNLKCGSKLRFVDISHNKLMGFLPSCLGTESENRVVNLEGNCLSSKFQHQHAVSYCTEVHVKKNTFRVGILVGVIIGAFLIIVVLALGIVVCGRCCHRGISEQHLLNKTVQDSSTTAVGLSSEILANARFISQASKLGKEELPVCRPYSLEELKQATNNFHDSTFMGENLYGKLYRGKLENGKQVTIRSLPLSKKYSFRNFKLRLDLLARLRHPHLVSLLGHCIDGVVAENNGTNVFLIYEYVHNGSFRSYLSGTSSGKVFSWSERLAVLVSIAKAVHFLHTGMIPGFVKNQLKTNNILLNENWTAKLSDYGLSIISEEADMSEGKGENAGSWEMKRLEDDIYGFGFILLEALLGPSVSAKKEAILPNVMACFNSEDGWKQIVDPAVQASCCQESLFIVISITNKSISTESWSRPSIEDVLWNLQYASQVQANSDADHRLNPTTPHHQ
ncbi:probable inactive leucine-rich repeat receptor-like protein kinase At3g03770 [Neltuma alba]|uniref:probable inactive leucine-rich repeat receptor-like protein kinase At3g03770 n=1 Tax=Neltuma alba TaxID=207710 RepID=UPI0010A4E543|nr:probable inactive leucine-rich repeat receptor-like protein kinase At3g03770 [Prosopis alba]XP_028788152.1 probable inactive leucine-rich repeat receptor-like protein kinase At3g03770 [Prosopis alba]